MGVAADLMPATMAALCHGVNFWKLLQCVVVASVGAPFQRDSSYCCARPAVPRGCAQPWWDGFLRAVIRPAHVCLT
jgi:hypothetical protein